ncbi:hypothetical protein [Enhygromyxa salina]|uniref:hypothetical protein n=1 Tax=Enhygromyxa salina TaxID=215803 RepID=UPI0011B1CD5F|nr:hypothetical protein [Enhygromyxa salina]
MLLKIVSETFPGRIVHERALSPVETRDGSHDAEWDGIITQPGALQGERLAPPYGPAKVELVYDQTYRDEASFSLARAEYLFAQRSMLRHKKGSALLLPGPLSDFEHPLVAVACLLRRASRLDDPTVVLVGHASPSGSASVNDTISRARADGLCALLEEDTDAWVRIATDHGSLPEIVAYFHYLTTSRGWALTESPPPPDIATNEAKPIVRRFQEQYNEFFDGDLEPDGKCGKLTLGAVFRALRRDLEQACDVVGAPLIALHAKTPTLAASHAFATEFAEVQADEDAQLVDVLALPAASADGLGPELLYQSASFRGQEVPTEEAELGNMFIGELVLATDIHFDRRTQSGVVFELEGSGGFQRTVSMEEGAQNGAETDLRFDGVPKDQRYTLYCHYESGSRLAVFDQLSWGEMLHNKDSFEDVVDPFSGEPV